MKINLLLFCFAFNLFNAFSQNMRLYVGTYTHGDSKGIYQLEFNPNTGELSNKQLAIPIDNPSFLQYSPDKKYLYSVNQSETGFVSSYKVNENGTLSLLTRVSSHGGGPCHISVNEKGDTAAVSNYMGGSLSIYPINKDGSLNAASQVFNHSSKDEKSHVHSARFFKDNLFVADLGRNAVYQYKAQKHGYTLKSDNIVRTKGNPGPRHFDISKDGTYLYVINEYGASITSIKKTGDHFKQIDFDGTLTKAYKGKNKCADIHLSPDEQFLYGSNRGENTIAVFKRNTSDGTLEKIQNESVHGDWPRNFTLDPSGEFLLVANKNSNNISVFKIDTISGKLHFLSSTNIPSPVCLLF